MVPAILNSQNLQQLQVQHARAHRPSIRVLDACTSSLPQTDFKSIPSRPDLPSRAATAPTPSPTRLHSPLPSTLERQLRWSDIVPPETGLTFGAVYDPEDGMVTFSGAELSSNPSDTMLLRESAESGAMDSPVDPIDPDNRSQVLTIERLAVVGAGVRTSVSTYGPYACLTTPLPMQTARCSSAGTSMVLDSFLQSSKTNLSRAQSNAQSNANSGSNTNAQIHSQASRYGYLLKAGKQSFTRLLPMSTPLKEVFSDPCWNVSGPLLRLGEYGRKGGRERSVDRLGERGEGDGGLLAEEEEEEDEEWHGYVHLEFTDGEEDEEDAGEEDDVDEEEDVQYARRRRTTLEMNFNLRSAFSWSSTSTSRYIDVSSALRPSCECDNGGPCPAAHNQQDDSATAAQSLAEWSTVEPPSELSTPNLIAYMNSQPIRVPTTPRKLQKPRRPRAKSDRQTEQSRPSAPAEEVLARSEYNHQRSESDHSCGTVSSSNSAGGTVAIPVLRVKIGLGLKPVLGAAAKTTKLLGCKCTAKACLRAFKRSKDMKTYRHGLDVHTQHAEGRDSGVDVSQGGAGVHGLHSRCRSEETFVGGDFLHLHPPPPLPSTPTSSRTQTWIQRRSGLSSTVRNARPLHVARSFVRDLKDLKLSSLHKDTGNQTHASSTCKHSEVPEAGWVNIRLDEGAGLEAKSLAPLSPLPVPVPVPVPGVVRVDASAGQPRIGDSVSESAITAGARCKLNTMTTGRTECALQASRGPFQRPEHASEPQILYETWGRSKPVDANLCVTESGTSSPIPGFTALNTGGVNRYGPCALEGGGLGAGIGVELETGMIERRVATA